MGSKKSFNILRYCKPLTPEDLLLSLFTQVFACVACYCYYLTLEGGDVEYLKSRAGWFAFLLVSSIVLLLGVFVGTSYYFRPFLRIGNLCVTGVLLLLTLTHDLGADLDNHGQFNLMIYFFLWLPILIGFSVYKTVNFARKLVADDTK